MGLERRTLRSYIVYILRCPVHFEFIHFPGGGNTRDSSNSGIGNSICKHGLKLCGSLLDYLGGAMI